MLTVVETRMPADLVFGEDLLPGFQKAIFTLGSHTGKMGSEHFF